MKTIKKYFIKFSWKIEEDHIINTDEVTSIGVFLGILVFPFYMLILPFKFIAYLLNKIKTN
jgi:hypothetical protein